MPPQSKRQQAREAADAGAPTDADLEAGAVTGEQARAAEEQSGQREQRFTRDDLLRDPAIAGGHSAAAIAAAWADAEYDDDRELTAAEVERLVSKSQDREVVNVTDEQED